MEAVLITLLVIVAVLAGAGVYATVRIKRAIQARVPDAVRAAEGVALRARSVSRPGAGGELARMRLELRSSLDATRRVLEGGAHTDPQLADAVELCDRLDRQAALLDGELRALEHEPKGGGGRQRLDAKLPELRERAERIGHAADSLRWAAQDRARHEAADELDLLSREVELEAGALRHWTPADRSLSEEERRRPLEDGSGERRRGRRGGKRLT